ARGAGSDGRPIGPYWTALRRPAPGSSREFSLRAEERRDRRCGDVPPAAPAARLQASIDRPPCKARSSEPSARCCSACTAPTLFPMLEATCAAVRYWKTRGFRTCCWLTVMLGLSE